MTTAIQQLRDLGQSIWLDNITRDLLDSGTLQRYIDELSVTGLTSNPTIYDQAIGSSDWYDDAIHDGQAGTSAEARSSSWRSMICAGPLTCSGRSTSDHGVDGWVSLEVSPLLAHDTHAASLEQVKMLHRQRQRPNVFIKIPGTPEGAAGDRGGDLRGRSDQRDPAVLARSSTSRRLPPIMRGIERRLAAGLQSRRRRRSRRCSSAGGTRR